MDKKKTLGRAPWTKEEPRAQSALETKNAGR